jgi:hypothetical protein
MDFLIANYHEPRQKIRALADSDCPLRAVFLEGGQHYGKSYLLKSLRSELETKLIVVELDKRRTIPTPVEILNEIGTVLGWQHFQRFDAAVRELRRQPVQAIIRDVTVAGSYNKIEAIAQENEDDRLILAIQLTRSFLQDLGALPSKLRPLILAFDGYDPAMSLLDRWFDRSLMHGLCQIDHVRIIVCGREVPSITVKERTPAGRRIDVALSGVMDEAEWMSIVVALKRQLPGDAVAVQTGYLRGVIAAFRGAPGLIMAHINSLRIVA